GAAGTAPIKLDTPESLHRHRTLAALLVADGTMPPAVNLATHAGERRTLSAEERTRILAALEGDAPIAIDRARVHAEPAVHDARRLLAPERVWTMPSRGGARLRTFVAPTDARRVRGIRWADPAELAQSPIRFASLAVDTRGVFRRLEAASRAEGGAGDGGVESMGNVGATPSGAIGALSRVAPECILPRGFHFEIPRGDVVIEVLAEPVGRTASVLPRIAWIEEAADESSRPVRAIAMPVRTLALEAATCQTQRLEHVVSRDVDIVGIMVKGGAFLRSARVTAGVALVDIPDFRMAFNEPFMLRAPHRVPAGGVIVAELGFDNTADNPQQPSDPPQAVFAGLPPFGEDAIVIVLYADAVPSR
ncbi:MAG: hypothetical protein RL354_1531, partial [Planctomycetota bacterium]